MKKLRNLLLVPFVGLILIGCDKPEQEPPKTELEKAVEIAKNDFLAENFKHDTVNTITSGEFKTLVEQTYEYDGNKVHTITHNVSFQNEEKVGEGTADAYLEFSEEVTYLYQYVAEAWTKTEYPGLTKHDQKLGIFDVMLEKFSTAATKTEEGYYYVEDFTYTVNMDDALKGFLAAIAQYDGYTCSQESFEFKYDYVKLLIQDDHLAVLELSQNSLALIANNEEHTYALAYNEEIKNVSKSYNFRDFGTTTVTLPTVE